MHKRLLELKEVHYSYSLGDMLGNMWENMWASLSEINSARKKVEQKLKVAYLADYWVLKKQMGIRRELKKVEQIWREPNSAQMKAEQI